MQNLFNSSGIGGATTYTKSLGNGLKGYNSPISVPIGQKVASTPTDNVKIVGWRDPSVLDVKIIQRRLNDLGYTGKDGQKLIVDGDFQTNTLHAVKEFQRNSGLAVDGLVGNHTWKALGVNPNTEITDRLYKTTVKGLYENIVSSGGKRLEDGELDPKTYYLFYNMVKDSGPMDLKRQDSWKSEYFIFDGRIVRSDAPGNIAYGIAGKMLNIPLDTLLRAAGAAQVKGGEIESHWQNDEFYGDDPMDQLNIRIGFFYALEKGW